MSDQVQQEPETGQFVMRCGCLTPETHVVRHIFERESTRLGLTANELNSVWTQCGATFKNFWANAKPLLSGLGLDEAEITGFCKRVLSVKSNFNSHAKQSGAAPGATTVAHEPELKDALHGLHVYEKNAKRIIELETELTRLKEEQKKYAPVLQALSALKRATKEMKEGS